MTAEQLGYIIETYEDGLRYTYPSKGIVIHRDLYKTGRNTHIFIEYAPSESRFWEVKVRVNDEEELAMLLVKVKLIADTLIGTTNV